MEATLLGGGFKPPKIPILTFAYFSDGLKKTTNQPTNLEWPGTRPPAAFTHHQRPQGATMSVHGQQRRLEEVRSQRGGFWAKRVHGFSC